MEIQNTCPIFELSNDLTTTKNNNKMKALEKLIAEYEKQIEIYLDENMFCPDRKKQYEKCCTISQCCKLLGMTENQDNRIIYRVQTKIKNKKYN